MSTIRHQQSQNSTNYDATVLILWSLLVMVSRTVNTIGLYGHPLGNTSTIPNSIYGFDTITDSKNIKIHHSTPEHKIPSNRQSFMHPSMIASVNGMKPTRISHQITQYPLPNVPTRLYAHHTFQTVKICAFKPDCSTSIIPYTNTRLIAPL